MNAICDELLAAAEKLDFGFQRLTVAVQLLLVLTRDDNLLHRRFVAIAEHGALAADPNERCGAKLASDNNLNGGDVLVRVDIQINADKTAGAQARADSARQCPLGGYGFASVRPG